MSDDKPKISHEEALGYVETVKRGLQGYATMFEELRQMLVAELEQIQRSEDGNDGTPMLEVNKAKFEILRKVSAIMEKARKTIKEDKHGG